MNWKRLVMIVTPVLLALLLFISFTLVNPKEAKEVNNWEIPLDNVSLDIISMAEEDNDEIVKVETVSEDETLVQDEEVILNEEIDTATTPEEVNISKDKEKVVAVSRGNDSLESRQDTSKNLSGYLNNYVLDIISTYKIGNDYPYLLNNDYENYNGVTEDIIYNGQLLLKSHPSGIKYSHCTGITFEVFFKAMQQRNKELGLSTEDFNGMTKDELHDFMLLWYVAKGPKSESNLTVAIEKYGLGQKITNYEDVRAGDFIDLSRENNTGHAVIFINWIRSNDKIIGIKHWSSQGSTNGISYKEEYFNIKNHKGVKYGNVIYDDLHIARIYPTNEYKRFK